jgi:hypothetical protein
MYWSNDEVKKGVQRSMHGTCCGQKTVTADPGKWTAAWFVCSTYVNVKLRSMWCLGDDAGTFGLPNELLWIAWNTD